MRSEAEPLAILLSDVHLSHVAPVARALEKDWYRTQIDYLRQIASLKVRLEAQARTRVVVVIAGDVFDRWNSPAELINMALAHLTEDVYVVAGQHDLPYHDLSKIHKSALGTLVQSGRVTLLGDPAFVAGSQRLRLHGFHWKQPIQPPRERHDLVTELCVAHVYVHTKKTGYHGAPTESLVKNFASKLKGYDVALFGDNHKSFLCEISDCTVFNPGSFMRRKSDERDHRPQVGVLYSDSRVVKTHLDVTRDVFVEPSEIAKVALNANSKVSVSELLKELLKNTESSCIDVRLLARRLLDERACSDEVRRIVDSVLSEMKG